MALTILVVDEDAAAVAKLVATLAEAGFATTGAQTFRDASKILSPSDPSILIANVRLGAYNGLHLLLRGQAEHPQMLGIIIGPADAATEREALRLGAAAYLPRPVRPETVIGEVLKLRQPAAAAREGRWEAEETPAPRYA
jgi:two-component system response regulator RegA